MTPLKKIILLYLKGLAMGSADVVPGVSGGTIAFITGIYERLLNAIRSIGTEALNLLRRLWRKTEERRRKREDGLVPHRAVRRKMNCSTSLRVLCASSLGILSDLRTLRLSVGSRKSEVGSRKSYVVTKLKTHNFPKRDPPKGVPGTFGAKLKTHTWNRIDGTFLAVLMAGIATSVLTSARLITHLLSTCPIQVWSFFFGLIVVSSLVMLRQIKKWNFGVFLSILSGIAAAYLITAATPSETPEASWFLFIAGAVAVCAMILPGISGSFILLLFGKYEYVLTAIKDFKIAELAIFGLGCLVGLLSFARVISWLFKKFHNTTVGLLSGFMMGSLNKVWPWKETVQTYTNRHNEVVPLVEKNVLPGEYLEKTGQEPFFLQAILFAAGGFLIVLIIDWLASYLKSD